MDECFILRGRSINEHQFDRKIHSENISLASFSLIKVKVKYQGSRREFFFSLHIRERAEEALKQIHFIHSTSVAI